MKTVEQCQKAISQAISRAYDIRLAPDDIRTEHATRDVRSFISKTAGKPHPTLDVASVAALALSRVEKMSGDEALASTIADLSDGGISLDRQAAAPRKLEQLMARHRNVRAQKNPLPADLKAKARATAPRVIRRSGQSAIRAPTPPARPTTASIGSRVKFQRLDDESVHVVWIGSPPQGTDPGSARVVPAASPLGQGLRGVTAGTILSLTFAGTPVEVEVLEVTPQGKPTQTG